MTTLVSIFGGKDHSIAITEPGQCLIWGRIDKKALGIGLEDMPSSDITYDEYSRPRILKQPNILNNISAQIMSATAGSDHSSVITEADRLIAGASMLKVKLASPVLTKWIGLPFFIASMLKVRNWYQLPLAVSSVSWLGSIWQRPLILQHLIRASCSPS